MHYIGAVRQPQSALLNKGTFTLTVHSLGNTHIIESLDLKEIIMYRKILTALAATGIILSAAACNTVKGLGNDIESVGQAGSQAIR